MTPEGKVKRHLRKRVEALDGMLRYVKWVGRNSAPDCRVMFRQTSPYYGCNSLVETKANKGQLSIGQQREINRLRDHGETVVVCLSTEDVDREFPAPAPRN